MSINPLLLPVTPDIETIQKTVLTNIVKMLCNRKWILREKLDSKIKEITDTYNDDQIYKIQLDVNLTNFETYDPESKKMESLQGNVVVVKLLSQKITSIGKSPIILEFLNNYKKNHKILIVDSISEKQKHVLISKKYLEIFNESFFMLDLLSHVYSPQYEVLLQDQVPELLKTYHMGRRQLKKMYDSDPASLYLFLKPTQVVRIIRDSEISGKSIDYRIVVHKGI